LKRLLISIVLLLTACASSAPQPNTPPPLPEWEMMPGGIVESLCRRLRQDALGENSALVLVRTTQPIANAQSLTALAAASAKRKSGERNMNALRAQRSIPIETVAGSCAWQAVDAVDPLRHGDTMIVELSSPLQNPFEWRNVGIFARVSLGGSHASWYWISIAPYGGGWAVAQITPLVM
jgi:hypothetical protein